MYTIEHHTTEIVADKLGYSIICDGVALWRGLTKEAAETILRRITIA